MSPPKRDRDESGRPVMVDGGSVTRPPKRAKSSPNNQVQQDTKSIVKHALLAQYYPEVITLREYAIARLPQSSKIRRRKIASVGSQSLCPEKTCTEEELALGDLLDTTLVGCRDSTGAHIDRSGSTVTKPDYRWEQWISFSQRGDESYVTLSDGVKGSYFSQSEIVDFVIWLLFSREGVGKRPKHMLCDGFRTHTGPRPPGGAGPTLCDIPGIFSAHPNHCVRALKEPPWPQLLLLFGKEGERIMIDLLLDCSIFISIKAGKDNLYQVCGTPIAELQPLARDQPNNMRADTSGMPQALRPTDISFVRSRMMYARAALNARGLVHFGLRHIHVLNRFPLKARISREEQVEPQDKQQSSINEDESSTIHVMMYIFPRQFGLHNAFTSIVDRQQTAQKFQDYTLREEEITSKYPKVGRDGQPVKPSTPKRLRGAPRDLVRKLQVLHSRCAYAEMVQHYCPVPEKVQDKPEKSLAPVQTQSSKSRQLKKLQGKSQLSACPPPEPQYNSLTELATPISSISAFCQAVLSKIIPNEFWGKGAAQEHNKKCFLKQIHHFIHLRRFESMNLHDVMQGMKITDIEWLMPPGLGNSKCSQSDLRKRTEIFYEFLYYTFDSLLIPLIRSNFYVTESNVHRYRLFFFRQDVWRYVAEPAMASLKAKMLEEVKLEDAMRILDSRRLGFAQVRLLPKQLTMRPIMNLRRRTMLRGNNKILGPSINTILAPVGSMLKLEKTLNPSRLGSAMFSVGDIYQRIKAFKTKLGSGRERLYFAKVDVQAAFDTIPQDAMVKLLRRIPSAARYKLTKHAEIQQLETASSGGSSKSVRSKVSKRWHSVAKTSDDATSFQDALETSLATNKRNTVFVGNAAQQYLGAKELLALTESHIEQNLVRIGKKYYRQKNGIPQGSVLSSTLCNYFYADLERKHLAFLEEEDGDCLLLRLIDDFLLITTDKSKATRFVEVMHRGLPTYGVSVSPGKSLVNFELTIDGVQVSQCESTTTMTQGLFPYCGLLIDCKTLHISKQRETDNPKKDPIIFNSLSVEHSRCPGQNFIRKVLHAFKIQSHLMFFDTSLNSYRAVLQNAYAAFVETATKTWAYARCLPKSKRPTLKIMKRSVQSLIEVAYALLASRSRKARYPGYTCSVRKPQLAWLAMVAFRQVFVRKQTGYKEVIAWLEEETLGLSRSQKVRRELDCGVLVGVARACNVRT